MKIFISTISFLAVLVALMFCPGCNNKSDLLVGSWQVDTLKYTREIPREMQPTINQSVNDMKSNFLLTYNSDGTYTTTMRGQVLNGRWKLNWNSSKLNSVSERGATKNFEVLELSKERFVFSANEGGDDVIFVMLPAK